MSRSEELKQRLETGRILPVQIQLAAGLGSKPARLVGLPTLPMEQSEEQRQEDVHQGLPPDLKRFLRSATRSRQYALPVNLSVTWGADCAERVLEVFGAAVRNDDRPQKAVETVRALLAGDADVAECRAAARDANEAIPSGKAPAKTAFSRPRTVGGVSVQSGVEAAAYAAREALDAILQSCDTGQEESDWVRHDRAAVHAGHAANWAAHALPDPAEEFAWQRRRLIELILSWNTEDWYSEESKPEVEEATAGDTAADEGTPEEKTRAYEVAYTLGVIFTGVGFVGLRITGTVRRILGIPEQDIMATVVSAVMVYILSGMFILGCAVLLPLGVVLEKRAKGTIPWSPVIPNWLVPIVIVLAFAVLLLAYLTSI